ncbi:MAG: M23 family metallopeptidase [Saprospiraceae bacterium]
MPDTKPFRKRLLDRLKHNFRILILDDENLEEVGSYNLSLLSFYTLLSVIGLILSSLVISLIVFTPVKRLIPGYGDITDNKKFIELLKRVDTLEQEITAYDVYTSGLKNMLTGGIHTQTVSREDSLIAAKSIPTELIKQEDLLENKRAKELNFLRFVTPVRGTISAHFQPSIQHYGVDIMSSKDAPVSAIMDGIVINADMSFQTGNSIYIQHPKNVVSVYKHNSALLVKTGDIVKTGQAIAIIGNSGEMSTGPHLHFEMWYDGRVVNPENYINFN